MEPQDRRTPLPVRGAVAQGAGNFVFRKSNTTSTAFSAFSWVIPVLFTIRFITCSFMVNSRPAHDELRAGYCQKQPASCSPAPDLVSHHLSLLILLFPVFFFGFLISSFLILHSYPLALNIISVCWILFAVIWLLAAFATKKSVYRESTLQRLRYINTATARLVL